jgi:hypothetical protein
VQADRVCGVGQHVFDVAGVERATGDQFPEGLAATYKAKFRSDAAPVTCSTCRSTAARSYAARRPAPSDTVTGSCGRSGVGVSRSASQPGNGSRNSRT